MMNYLKYDIHDRHNGAKHLQEKNIFFAIASEHKTETKEMLMI